MQHDPFPKPLNLALTPGGPWEYVDPETGAKFVGQSFWQVAKQLWRWRVRNKKKRASYELAQMDLLIEKRKRLKLPVDFSTAKPEIQPREEVRPLDENERIMGVIDKLRIGRKRSGGCKSCGKTKALH